MRADAARNREKVLEAARELFASKGFEVPLDEIATQAGVGPGTVYRHFPTKQALLGAIAEDRFRQLAVHAQAALEIDDPWTALTTFVHRGAELHASDRALSEL
ncbi:MAG: hypothetical protein QOF58_8830, partial [Pseudonocardiales bacterium]|nr:hypothetical protein [Pseudonocardiales bacterium]